MPICTIYTITVNRRIAFNNVFFVFSWNYLLDATLNCIRTWWLLCHASVSAEANTLQLTFDLVSNSHQVPRAATQPDVVVTVLCLEYNAVPHHDEYQHT